MRSPELDPLGCGGCGDNRAGLSRTLDWRRRCGCFSRSGAVVELVRGKGRLSSRRLPGEIPRTLGRPGDAFGGQRFHPKVRGQHPVSISGR